MADYKFINNSGTIVADTSETKAEVEAEQQLVFGEDVDLSDESPNGVMANAETISRNDIAENNANLANQINPNLAGNVFLDALWALTYAITGGRKGATFSTFSTPPDMTGQPFKLIPEGSIATANGQEFKSVADVTLDAAGEGAVNFKAVESGPIPAAIGELDTIAPGGELGWETITNSVAATLGRDIESDEASRQRRVATLALQGISVSLAVTSAVMDLDNVKSLKYRENYTDGDLTIDGVFLLKNSVWACVDGGDSAEIATALLENKTCGANWNGAESENVTDPITGQIYPVKFDRPDEENTWIRITIKPTTISNPEQVVTDSVLKYAEGETDGQAGFVVGADVSPYEIASAVNIDTPEIFVSLVELSDDGAAWDVATIPIAIDAVARTAEDKITVLTA
jgi:hypothetical protein